MKVDQIITITKSAEIEILDVTLLSKEEYEKCKKYIPLLDKWWWLRSFGNYQGDSAIINNVGSIFSSDVDLDDAVIRPALSILKSPSLRIGDKFKLVGYTWTIIDETIALCDSHIGECCFRKDWKAENANVYEVSDVKKHLENWAKENNLI